MWADQLAWNCSNPRVVVMEKTSIRHLEPGGTSRYPQPAHGWIILYLPDQSPLRLYPFYSQRTGRLSPW